MAENELERELTVAETQARMVSPSLVPHIVMAEGTRNWKEVASDWFNQKDAPDWD